MSVCKINHNILIENLKENEIINQPILIIKGKIKSKTANCIENKIKLKYCQEEYLETLIGHKGEFKFLINLEQYLKCDLTILHLHFYICEEELNLQLRIQKELPRKYQLKPLLLLCADETNPKELAKDKIDLNLKLIQSIYADKLQEHALGRKTFVLSGSCTIFRSKVITLLYK